MKLLFSMKSIKVGSYFIHRGHMIVRHLFYHTPFMIHKTHRNPPPPHLILQYCITPWVSSHQGFHSPDLTFGQEPVSVHICVLSFKGFLAFCLFFFKCLEDGHISDGQRQLLLKPMLFAQTTVSFCKWSSWSQAGVLF